MLHPLAALQTLWQCDSTHMRHLPSLGRCSYISACLTEVFQKLNTLRIESDAANEKAEELQARNKVLEQENLAKEQEITSLQHKNGLLEAEIEKLESGLKEAKAAADEGSQHGSHNEALQRRLQLLEEEAEEADKNLRETNDK